MFIFKTFTYLFSSCFFFKKQKYKVDIHDQDKKGYSPLTFYLRVINLEISISSRDASRRKYPGLENHTVKISVLGGNLNVTQAKKQQIFPVKDKVLNISGFVHHTLSVILLNSAIMPWKQYLQYIMSMVVFNKILFIHTGSRLDLALGSKFVSLDIGYQAIWWKKLL